MRHIYFALFVAKKMIEASSCVFLMMAWSLYPQCSIYAKEIYPLPTITTITATIFYYYQQFCCSCSRYTCDDDGETNTDTAK